MSSGEQSRLNGSSASQTGETMTIRKSPDSTKSLMTDLTDDAPVSLKHSSKAPKAKADEWVLADPADGCRTCPECHGDEPNHRKGCHAS